jgi:ribose-phosphate pyrophosphokinase
VNGLKIVSGNANPGLAKKVTELVVEKFNTRYVDFLDEVLWERRSTSLERAMDPLRFEDVWCEARVSYFPDNEVYAHVEKTVRGQCVFVIQPTCPPRDGLSPGGPGPRTVNDHLMELLLLIDALKRASAERICAVVPYFGYARQDRKTEGRVPISARLVANLVERAGATRVLAMELHASQIQGFFDIPVDHLRTDHLFARHIQARHPDWVDNLVVVSPDIGGLFRARRVAERLQSPFATLAKRRFERGKLDVLLVIGDVDGKKVLLVDDILSTGGTLLRAVYRLKEQGAAEIYAACTHGIFAGDALERIETSPLSRVIVTDTIPQAAAVDHPKVEVISVAEDLAEAIIRIYLGLSISELLVRGR